MNSLISIQNLKIDLMTPRGVVQAVRNINLDIKEGEIHGIVGESGCGKTMTAKAILRLHDESKTLYRGKVLYNKSNDVLKMSKRELLDLRGNKISMIFQDPITTLNPLIKIGKQMTEMLQTHQKISDNEAKETVIKLLESVGIYPGSERFNQYPFEMSGGMLQRVVIAMAISCNPQMLIADEPTTALDVTMQAQVLELMQELQKKFHMAVMIITHNFGVVAEICDTVSVMYAGQIIEYGNVYEIFHNAKHPYTVDLINSIPKSDSAEKKLVTIPGNPPDLREILIGCPYAPRCQQATEKCSIETPMLTKVSDTHGYSCHKI